MFLAPLSYTFAGKLTADIGDFTPGSVYGVGRLPDGRFGSFICFEATFPDAVRRFTAGGAELLINISNDGWFGRSAAPAQHLMMARVRAVENRRWLLRDTNNGFTVSVDPYGRIVAELPTDIADSSKPPTTSAATSRLTSASATGSPGSASSRRSSCWEWRLQRVDCRCGCIPLR